MNKFILIGLFSFLMLSSRTDSPKDDRIVFIRLYPYILYDSDNSPNLYIKQYIEYRFENDSLYTGKSDNLDEKKAVDYGLDKFYTCKAKRDFSLLMKKISMNNYDETYTKQLGESSIDDRQISLIAIKQNSTIKIGIVKLLYTSHCLVSKRANLRNAQSYIQL